jgi:hypothetical protein
VIEQHLRLNFALAIGFFAEQQKALSFEKGVRIALQPAGVVGEVVDILPTAKAGGFSKTAMLPL